MSSQEKRPAHTPSSLRNIHDPTLNEIVRRLVAAVQPEAIFLFGSRARGEATLDSDYDLLLLVSDNAEQLRAIQRRAYLSLSDLGIAADIVAMNHEFFNRRRQALASLPATVEREGRLLYAA